jgi:DNA-binding NarL/FixJ family response regulator
MVITDIFMPRLGGLEASREIKEFYLHVNVLILTVRREKAYRDKAVPYGAEGYVVKDDVDLELYSVMAAVPRGQIYVSKLLVAIS